MRWFLVTILSTAALPLGAQTQPAACEQYLGEGVQFQNAERYAETAKAYSAALDDVTRRLGPEHIAVAPILMCIGALHVLQRDYSGANAAYERALTIVEKVFGPEHIQVGFTLGTIAMLRHKQGLYAAAEVLYRRALTILEKNLGPAHERTAFFEASMGKLYLVQQRNTEAEMLLEKAIPVLEDAGPADRAVLAVALNDLAEAYQRDGRYAKAEPLYVRVLALVANDSGVINDDIRTGLGAYVQMLRKTKRKTEARELDQQIKNMLPR
jgi:tetratricopeptide (TPR) repeat protein